MYCIFMKYFEYVFLIFHITFIYIFYYLLIFLVCPPGRGHTKNVQCKNCYTKKTKNDCSLSEIQPLSFVFIYSIWGTPLMYSRQGLHCLSLFLYVCTVLGTHKNLECLWGKWIETTLVSEVSLPHCCLLRSTRSPQGMTHLLWREAQCYLLNMKCGEKWGAKVRAKWRIFKRTNKSEGAKMSNRNKKNGLKNDL
jgi:hypothetical protein